MMMNEEHWKAYQEARKNMLKCSKCGKPMVNAIDQTTGKISKYIWKFDCKCRKEDNFRISLG